MAGDKVTGLDRAAVAVVAVHIAYHRHLSATDGRLVVVVALGQGNGYGVGMVALLHGQPFGFWGRSWVPGCRSHPRNWGRRTDRCGWD